MGTATPRPTVVGVFDSRDQAERAVDELHRAGFTDDQIGLAMRDTGTTGAMAEGPTTGETRAGADAGAGLVAGAGIGAILGALATGLIPGIGPVIAAGLLAGIVGGAVIGGAAGGLIGALVGMGVPEEEAQYYNQEFEAGRVIVTVKADGRYNEAQEILRSYGAYDIQTRGGMASTAPDRGTWGTTTETATERGTYDRDVGTAGRTLREGETMPLREEQLRTDKERVQAGEVRVGKDVVTEQREIDVPVTREEVVVERRPVTPRPADRADFTEEEREIRVPVTEERVDVEKQPMVTGEVTVGKREVAETQRVSDTVRREKPVVEREGDVPVERRGAGMAESERTITTPTTGESTTTTTWDQVMPTYRSWWEQRYGATGNWTDYEPRYRFAWERANDPEYRGRSWTEVEPMLRRNWESRYHESTWNQVKDSIREAWDRVTSGVSGR